MPPSMRDQPDVRLGCSCCPESDPYSVSSTGPNGCRTMTSATTAGRDATPSPMSIESDRTSAALVHRSRRSSS
jgi:hypothetical protein